MEKAYQMAQRARELRPRDPYAADTLGWILFKRGEYPWALTLLQESADKLAAEPEVLFHLGMAHYMMGQEEPARSALRRALDGTKDFNGKDTAARRLAVLELKPGSSDPKTIAALESQLATDKQDPVALVRLGAAYEATGDIDKARKAYDQALTVTPESVPLMVKVAEFYAVKLRDPQKAMQLAKDARALAPNDASIARTLGRLASQSAHAGDFGWALSLLQQSAREFPNDPDVQSDLAAAYETAKRLGIAEFNRGNFTPAAQLLKESSRGRTDDAELFYYLGMSHYRLKQKTDSKKALNQALALNLSSPLAAEAKRILPELN
jgi:Flp pilus assembly protein TadD